MAIRPVSFAEGSERMAPLTYAIVTMGGQRTGGYSVAVTRVAEIDGSRMEVLYRTVSPAEGGRTR